VYTSERAISKKLQRQQSVFGKRKEIRSDGMKKSELRNDPPATLPIFLVNSLLTGVYHEV
jgi:hypothetical protein